ncbi:hypothetical protein ACHAWF_003026, partial [Thalassiosira exigua]
AFSRIEGLKAEVKIKDDELIEIRLKRDQLKEENAQLRKRIASLEQRKLVLCYDDLHPGGVLVEYVIDFTFFPDCDCSDAFRELVNFTNGWNPGEGLYERLVCYHMVSIEKRKEFQEAQAGNESNDAETGLAATIADANAEAEAEPKRRGRKRKLH